MDISLARTFLAIAQTGSFLGAAERLHVTQTAVSARIRSLETLLGRRLFVRNKAGARLTAAGERFQADAATLVQVWERARQRVALPTGYANSISIGGEPSLWNPLLVDWLVWMRRHHDDMALRAEVDTPEQLLAKVHNGTLDVAIAYNPPVQPDMTLELLAEEKLIMVTTAPNGNVTPARHVHVDWGPGFTASEQAAFQELSPASVTVSLGPLALAYLLTVGGSGYFRESVVRPHLKARRLWRVRQAPMFSYSVHAIYSARGEADLISRARAGLRACIGAQGGRASRPPR